MRFCSAGDELDLDDDLIVAGDNALALARLPEAAFDLIYLDPPFNTGRPRERQTLQVRADEGGARVGFGGRRYSARLIETAHLRGRV